MTQLKTLDEIGRLASERSTEAISKLLKKKVTLESTLSSVEAVEEIVYNVDPEREVIGIYLPVTGAITGASLLLFTKEVGLQFCDLLLSRELGTSKDVTPLEERLVLQEIGNIVTGNYLTVLADELKIDLVGGLPNFRCDKIGVILDQLISEFISEVREGLVVEINFAVSMETRLRGQLMLLFDHRHCQEIFNLLSM